MALTREDVAHIAELVKLELSEAEVERLARQLSEILDAAARLDRLDTESISPTASVLPLHNVWREDQVVPSLDRALVLRNAPETDPAGEFFKVKPILP